MDLRKPTTHKVTEIATKNEGMYKITIQRRNFISILPILCMTKPILSFILYIL